MRVLIVKDKNGEIEAWDKAAVIADKLNLYEAGFDLIREFDVNARIGDTIYPFINGLDRRLTVTAGPC